MSWPTREEYVYSSSDSMLSMKRPDSDLLTVPGVVLASHDGCCVRHRGTVNGVLCLGSEFSKSVAST